MSVPFTLITIQALLGGIDNLWHHEITERLPARRAAAGELSLHALPPAPLEGKESNRSYLTSSHACRKLASRARCAVPL